MFVWPTLPSILIIFSRGGHNTRLCHLHNAILNSCLAHPISLTSQQLLFLAKHTFGATPQNVTRTNPEVQFWCIYAILACTFHFSCFRCTFAMRHGPTIYFSLCFPIFKCIFLKNTSPTNKIGPSNKRFFLSLQTSFCWVNQERRLAQ